MNEATPRTSLLPVIVGNAFEWFDFTVYGFFATSIARQFFPPGNEEAAWLGTAAAFAVAFVMRPIGALTFGLIGDRQGRKTALTLTLALMALGTALIGLAPTYARIGIVATEVLVLGRLLQGFSASGEAGSALTLIVESVSTRQRGTAVAWLNVGVYSALVLGSLAGWAVSALLPPESAQAWGWRLPFLLGLAVAPIGLYMRRHMDESRPFLARRQRSHDASDVEARPGQRQVLSGIATVVGLAGFGSPVVYLILVFMPAFAVRELHLPQAVPMLSTLLASLVLVLLLVPMGMLCDRIGSKRLIVVSSVVGTLLVVPLTYHLTRSPSLAALLLLQCPLSACLAIYVAGCGPLVVELFPIGQRALGVGLGYNLGIMVFGGFAPLVTAWLIAASGEKTMPAWYASVGGLISAAVALRLRERGTEEAGSIPPREVLA